MRPGLLAIIYPVLVVAFCLLTLYLFENPALNLLSLYFMALFWFDSIARYEEYKTIRKADQSCWFKHETRLKRMRFSKCQRNAAVAGSRNKSAAREFYYRLGYRWYHLLPDKTFTLDSPLLKPGSWRQTLGID